MQTATPGRETDSEIGPRLKRDAQAVNRALADCLASSSGVPPRLAEAVGYSLLGGGKRLRPILVLWSCEACGGATSDAMPAALAVECVHTFSLIHDDLPALDNDDMRRGQPSCHRRFDEATAILAGDALLALAFEIIADRVRDSAAAVATTRELAAAAGWRGMIGGESEDIEAEGQDPDRDRVAAIHGGKTARLIQAACRLGGIAALADETLVAALGDYGFDLGLSFQATDDLLDVTANDGDMGKPTRKDAASGKQTYPRAVGVEETQRLAAAAAERAVAALKPFGDRAEALSALARQLVRRRS